MAQPELSEYFFEYVEQRVRLPTLLDQVGLRCALPRGHHPGGPNQFLTALAIRFRKPEIPAQAHVVADSANTV